ncbi:hypothetical protein K504DRAFT_492717 [Pleomassaria siparia CBS 279.74]|uniref:Uncharacterized protein n=1 Tax=Pleomassaria siparia CBS 279.74 TaxID=1314801 RepID=A0A6G1K483_9PLEO|nr:hypothetical protein K504DRAFT_492717 [Pleomassaria siparia CBS 279.74]
MESSPRSQTAQQSPIPVPDLDFSERPLINEITPPPLASPCIIQYSAQALHLSRSIAHDSGSREEVASEVAESEESKADDLDELAVKRAYSDAEFSDEELVEQEEERDQDVENMDSDEPMLTYTMLGYSDEELEDESNGPSQRPSAEYRRLDHQLQVLEVANKDPVYGGLTITGIGRLSYDFGTDSNRTSDSTRDIGDRYYPQRPDKYDSDVSNRFQNSYRQSDDSALSQPLSIGYNNRYEGDVDSNHSDDGLLASSPPSWYPRRTRVGGHRESFPCNFSFPEGPSTEALQGEDSLAATDFERKTHALQSIKSGLCDLYNSGSLRAWNHQASDPFIDRPVQRGQTSGVRDSYRSDEFNALPSYRSSLSSTRKSIGSNPFIRQCLRTNNVPSLGLNSDSASSTMFGNMFHEEKSELEEPSPYPAVDEETGLKIVAFLNKIAGSTAIINRRMQRIVRQRYAINDATTRGAIFLKYKGRELIEDQIDEAMALRGKDAEESKDLEEKQLCEQKRELFGEIQKLEPLFWKLEDESGGLRDRLAFIQSLDAGFDSTLRKMLVYEQSQADVESVVKKYESLLGESEPDSDQESELESLLS